MLTDRQPRSSANVVADSPVPSRWRDLADLHGSGVATAWRSCAKHLVVLLACAVIASLCAAYWAELVGAHWQLRHAWLFASTQGLKDDVTLLNSLFGLSLFILYRSAFAPWASMVFAVASALGLALASERKMQILDMPVLPWDLWFLRDMGAFAEFTGLGRNGLACTVGALLALSGTAAWRYRRFVFRRRGFLAGAIAGAAVCAAWIGWVVVPSTPRHLSGAMHNITWDQGANYANYGPYYTFLVNLKFVSIPPPTSAERAAAGAAERLHSSAVGPGDSKPDVVVILSESFTALPVAIFDKPFTCLKDALLSKLVTPAWGGFTANVEFEVLSGYPHALFPTGSIPYQMYLKRPLAHGLPNMFRQGGYRTSAIHTFQRNFFSRPTAYEMLGFDDYIGIEDLKNPKLRGQYVDDQVIFDELLNQLSTGGDQPQFIQAVSMMAHLPFDWPGRYPVSADVNARLPVTLEKHRVTLTQYASMVFDHEVMLCSFLEKIRARPHRTVVLFYGDHYPSFGSLDVYKDIHRALSPQGTAFDLYRQYSKTPLFLFDSKKGFLPIRPEFPSYNVGTLLMREAGLPLSGVWAMPHKLRNDVITEGAYVASNQSSMLIGASPPGPVNQELLTLKAHAYGTLFASP